MKDKYRDSTTSIYNCKISFKRDIRTFDKVIVECKHEQEHGRTSSIQQTVSHIERPVQSVIAIRHGKQRHEKKQEKYKNVKSENTLDGQDDYTK